MKTSAQGWWAGVGRQEAQAPKPLKARLDAFYATYCVGDKHLAFESLLNFASVCILRCSTVNCRSQNAATLYLQHMMLLAVWNAIRLQWASYLGGSIWQITLVLAISLNLIRFIIGYWRQYQVGVLQGRTSCILTSAG